MQIPRNWFAGIMCELIVISEFSVHIIKNVRKKYGISSMNACMCNSIDITHTQTQHINIEEFHKGIPYFIQCNYDRP